MSIAQAARIAQMERDLLELARTLTDTKALIREIEQRLQNIEARPRLGRPPKEQ